MVFSDVVFPVVPAHADREGVGFVRSWKGILKRIRTWIEGDNDDKTSHSCRYCQNLAVVTNEPEFNLQLHLKSRAEILEAALGGCLLFSWIEEELASDYRYVKFR